MTIQKKVAVGAGHDESGEPLEEWQDWRQSWAQIAPTSDIEFFQAEQIKGRTAHDVILRAGRTLDKASNRIKFGERILDINGVVDTEERGIRLKLQCSEAR